MTKKFPRMLYFGMQGVFSSVPLRYLLQQGVDVSAVVTPAAGDSRRELPVVQPSGSQLLSHVAASAGIPVIGMRGGEDAEALERLAGMDPEVAIVACFPCILPEKILKLAPLGFFNLHPSLLPAYRGPDPLFWQFRDGIANTGVTLHRMTPHVDAGDIIRQRQVALRDGIGGPEAQSQLSAAGAELMLELLAEFARGGEPEVRPAQCAASYHGEPGLADYVLETGWSARRAFNFMCGTAERGVRYVVSLKHQRLALDRALSFEPEAGLDSDCEVLGDQARIRFSPGVLDARLHR